MSQKQRYVYGVCDADYRMVEGHDHVEQQNWRITATHQHTQGSRTKTYQAEAADIAHAIFSLHDV